MTPRWAEYYLKKERESLVYNHNYVVEITSGGTIGNNEPVGGSISWPLTRLIYAGRHYTIVAGNTANEWVYLDVAHPTEFQTSSSFG